MDTAGPGFLLRPHHGPTALWTHFLSHLGTRQTHWEEARALLLMPREKILTTFLRRKKSAPANIPMWWDNCQLGDEREIKEVPGLDGVGVCKMQPPVPHLSREESGLLLNIVTGACKG